MVVAVAEGGLRGEVREHGRIANTVTALDRLLRKLGGNGMTLRSCYEAGPRYRGDFSRRSPCNPGRCAYLSRPSTHSHVPMAHRGYATT